jgi:hypothetical protein
MVCVIDACVLCSLVCVIDARGLCSMVREIGSRGQCFIHTYVSRMTDDHAVTPAEGHSACTDLVIKNHQNWFWPLTFLSLAVQLYSAHTVGGVLQVAVGLYSALKLLLISKAPSSLVVGLVATAAGSNSLSLVQLRTWRLLSTGLFRP